jgi:peptidoglycan/xylan/chitin deacetylase (PgdA/CDA1 family)
MYHVIGTPRAGAPYPQLYVSAKVLAGQMRSLDRHGYEVVRLQDVYDYWHGAGLTRKPVVGSFDDGFVTDATVARRILAAHGWAGTLNLALGATTTEYGLARRDELYRLHRIRVERSDGVAGLVAKLRRLG